MTGMVSSSKPTNELVGLVLGAGFATLAAIAMLGSHDLRLLVVAPFGGVGLIFAARRPLLAVIIMVVLEVTNTSGVLESHARVPVFQASLLLGLLAVGFAVRDPVARSRINAWTGICAALLATYLATQTIALIGSVDPAASNAGMHRIVLDCVFVMLVLLLIQLSGQPWAVAGAIAAPLAVLSILTAIDQFAFNGTMSFGGFSTVTTASGEDITTLRFGGPLPDSNFWGRHLVMGLPLAGALLTRALRLRLRVAVACWLVAVIALLVGVYLTQSRGTFLAAGVAITVWLIASDRSIRRRGLALLPLSLVFFALPGVGNRLVAALSDVTQAQTNSGVDPSVLGRLAAQQEALMMFEERPFFGFGPATFPGQVTEFAGRVSIAVLEPTNAPHNLYIEFAAESGVMGLLGWAVVVVGFITAVLLGIVANPRSHERVLLAAVCAAIVAWSIASIGLHMAYFRTLGVVLALAGGIAPALPVPVAAIRKLLQGAVVWLVAGAFGVALSLAYLAATATPAVTATQRMTLLPVGPTDGFYSYALDIRSRVEVLPTFATMFRDPKTPVDVTADPVRGLLTFTTTAVDADSARDEIQLAVARADSTLHSGIGYQQYSLQPVSSMGIEPTNVRSPQALFIAIGIGIGGALTLALVLLRAIGRRSAANSDLRVPRRDLTSV
ncbi:O-antigen ligase family protein [Mycolicibacterium hodleri]|nr:O-antigen ligase family protein [Mycolicibacterium hodleri]